MLSGRASRRPRARRAPSRTPRSGTTLVELLVALVLAALVASVVARSRSGSQAAASDAMAGAEARRQLRAGTGAVLATLRGIAPASGDLLALADTALELRVTTGVTVACGTSPAAADAPPSITLLAPGTSGDLAAAFVDAPAAGDRVLVLVRATAGRTPAASAPAWRWQGAVAAGPGTMARVSCLGRVAAPAWRVPLVSGASMVVPTGAPVRLLRRGRWSVYRSSGRWYLGWRDAGPGGVGLDVVQPVSGPHDARDSRDGPGASATRRAMLAFGVAARDEAAGGSALASITALTLRAASPVVRVDGARALESLTVVVALRNGVARASP